MTKNLFLVVDFKTEKEYDHIENFVFSPNSKQYAYLGKNGDRAHFILNGKEIKFFRWVTQITFSPDSERQAYAASNGGTSSFVVVNGISEGKSYFQILDLQFSNNSGRLSYFARKTSEDKWIHILDGKEGAPFDHGYHGCFNPDGKHYVYLPVRKAKTYLRVDEQEYPLPDGIRAFSDVKFINATTFQFLAKRNKELVRVVGIVAAP